MLGVSGLLQAMVNWLFKDGIIHAPLDIPNNYFPIVQYEDDTLLILQHSSVQLSSLKDLLEVFPQDTVCVLIMLNLLLCQLIYRKNYNSP
jgi:hypothetical protein